MAQRDPAGARPKEEGASTETSGRERVRVHNARLKRDQESKLLPGLDVGFEAKPLRPQKTKAWIARQEWEWEAKAEGIRSAFMDAEW
jgi:hypothetical protein